MIDENKLVMEIANWQMSLCPEYSDRDKATWEALEEVIEAVKEQPKAGEWIPFTVGKEGKLPDDGEEILVSDGDDVWVDTFERKGHNPCIKSSVWLAGCAWMPKPGPYKEGEC